MLTLAEAMSQNIDIVGKRPGERYEEYLVHESESNHAYSLNNLILIKEEPNPNGNNMPEGYSTLNAEKMSEAEITSLINSK